MTAAAFLACCLPLLRIEGLPCHLRGNDVATFLIVHEDRRTGRVLVGRQGCSGFSLLEVDRIDIVLSMSDTDTANRVVGWVHEQRSEPNVYGSQRAAAIFEEAQRLEAQRLADLTCIPERATNRPADTHLDPIDWR
jgi:hypothetical protein